MSLLKISGLKPVGFAAATALVALTAAVAPRPAEAQVPYQCPYGYYYSVAGCQLYSEYAPFGDGEVLGFGDRDYGRHGGRLRGGLRDRGFSGGGLPHGAFQAGGMGGDHFGGDHFGGGHFGGGHVGGGGHR